MIDPRIYDLAQKLLAAVKTGSTQIPDDALTQALVKAAVLGGIDNQAMDEGVIAALIIVHRHETAAPAPDTVTTTA